MAKRSERRRLGIRAQTTIGASVIVALALLVGAVVFVQALMATIHDTAGQAAETRLEEIADRLDDQGSNDLHNFDDELVQILNSKGGVITSSEEATDATQIEDWILPIVDFGDGEGRSRLDEAPLSAQIDDEPHVVAIEELDDERLLALGVSIEDQMSTVSTVIVLLAVGVPLVVALVAFVTWIVVGRALAPVTRIREEVQEINAEELGRRVQVPSTRDEVAALATTMNGMLDRLDAGAAAQRRFISDASHELRSPLATIRQHAEVALAYPDATTEQELAEVVHAEGLRLQGVVDSLLLLARLDEGVSQRRESVDLDDIMLAEAPRLRALGLDVDARRVGPGRVIGDPRLLAQLVRNLTDNAARHAHGHVTLAVESSQTTVTITVDDNGDGVHPSERDRVFDRFVRLDDARARDAGGSGLGLAIVREVAQAAGGTVEIRESPRGGARFRVTLPTSG